MRWLVLALAVSGCGFSIDTGGAVAGDDEPEMQPDAGSNAARMCSTDDPTLRLCIDFDDAANLGRDQFPHTVDAQNLMPMERKAGEQAVMLDDESRLHVEEAADLDIMDNLTVSMWISFGVDGLPTSTVNSRWLYDNNTQYFAQLRMGGIIRCGSGSEESDSPPIAADGVWHHIACTYQRNEIRTYVDGRVAGCEDLNNRPLPLNGREGFAIGANLVGGVGGPYFTEQFIGGMDNVQVFAKTMEAAEVCGAAGQTACAASCP